MNKNGDFSYHQNGTIMRKIELELSDERYTRMVDDISDIALVLRYYKQSDLETCLIYWANLLESSVNHKTGKPHE